MGVDGREREPTFHLSIPCYSPKPRASEMVPALRTCLLKGCFPKFGEKEMRMGVEINTFIGMKMCEIGSKAIAA